MASTPTVNESSDRDMEREFRELASRFAELGKDPAAADVATALNRLLDELNCLLPPATSFVVDHEVGEELLRAGIHLMSSPSTPINSDHLVTKFRSLVVNLLRRMQIVDKETVSLLLEYHTTTLKRCAVWVRPFLLNSLDAVLHCTSDSSDFLDEIIGPQGLLLEFATDDDPQTRRCALKCVENLTFRLLSATSQGYLHNDQTRRCLDLFLENLRCRDLNPPVEKSVQCKMLVSSLVGLKNLVTGSRMSDIDALGELLAVLKSLMFYALPGHGSLPPVDCLYPSPLSQIYLEDAVKVNQSSNVPLGSTNLATSSSSSPQNRKTNRKKRRSSRNRPGNAANRGTPSSSDAANEGSSPIRLNNVRWPSKASSSESEQSDLEAGVQASDAARLKSLQAKVRSSALAALVAVFEVVNRKITFGYLSSFLPSDDVAGASAVYGTLVGVFLKDPVPKVRSGALALLTTMLEGSKPFLALADDRDRCKTVAFIALSQTLASMIRALQRAIVLALVSETCSLVLTQAILCVAALVRAAPLERLAPGFAVKFVQHLRPMLDHKGKDSNSCVAALTALGTIVSVKPALGEISEQLEVDGFDTSWLIDVCVANVTCQLRTEKSVPLPVRIESLQVLAALTRVYFDHVLRNSRLNVIVGVIESGLLDADVSVKLQSAKLLEEFGKSFANVVTSSAESKKMDETATKAVVDIWTLLIGTCLPSLGPENSILLAQLCDCLSAMSADVYSVLPKNHQVLCKTLLLGFSRNDDRNVKAASVRALGAFAFYPCIREDCQFLADVLDVVVVAITEDESADVRIKAAWTLANVTDSLYLKRDVDGQSFLDEVIGDQLLRRISEAALAGTAPSVDGNDRVRSNTVRALGNLLRYFGPEHLAKKEFTEIANNSIDALHRCACSGSNMKVRWNACYALGNGFRNRLLLDARSSDATTKTILVSDDVLLALSAVAKECKNFKVRINAAAALAVPVSREAYGDRSMAPIIANLLAGLDNIEASMDFVAYQHKDNLVEQLCTSLCQLISLLRLSDVDFVSAVLESYSENFRRHLGRCVARQHDDQSESNETTTKKLSEFVAVYEVAKMHLSALTKSTSSSSESDVKTLASIGVIANAIADPPQPSWDKLVAI